ncbi:conserved protein, unknown function, partial [Hepatocystis sp. ex Piliocolobus tephrosceles]
MKENKLNDVVIQNEIKTNKRQILKNNIEEKSNKSNNNDLLKYKQSLYIIRKSINLLKHHYHNRLNKTNMLRLREKKQLHYLKRKNIILEDKCTFYSEHIDELKKIFT